MQQTVNILSFPLDGQAEDGAGEDDAHSQNEGSEETPKKCSAFVISIGVFLAFVFCVAIRMSGWYMFHYVTSKSRDDETT